MVRGISRDWRTKTKTIHNPELMDAGESITIKAWYSDNDRQAVLSASVVQSRNDDGEVVTRATLDRLRAVKRKLAVVGWVLHFEDGGDIPFDEETLLNLPTPLADFIDKSIDEEWDGLGTPVASKEEAARLEQEAKQDRSTFQRDSDGAAARTEANGRENVPARTGDSGSRVAGAAPKKALGEVRN